MKYLTFAVLGALVQGGSSATECASGAFTLNVEGYCNHTALLTSFTEWFEEPGNVAAGCTSTAEDELNRLLSATSTVEATAAVHSLCRSAFENYGEIPFETSTGKDARFVEEYFKGKSDWNEQVQTETDGDEGDKMVLKEDARAVDQFHDGDGKHHILGMPDLPNFDSCAMNAAYCCWPKDRQDDNDGNCDKPYDRNCVDANPGDNTDLCFVDQADGAKSTGYNATEGWFTFPFDDGNNNFKAEGPIHCHGFAWADDKNDPSYVYRGNNLFFVSLFDHMYTRGYVKSIAGAPMCGCAEQMPTVSRSDCTQIDFENQEHDFVFTFNAGGVVTAELDTLFIDFNACQGLDRDFDADNNDLWSYMNRLYVDDKISGDKLQMLSQKLVGDNNCQVGKQKGLAEQNLIRGHNTAADDWIFLDGRDSLDQNIYYGKAAFDHIIDADNNNSTLPIFRRACASCYFDQQWLYYKRVTPIPDNLDLWWHLRFGRKKVTGNEYGTDFLIYGSYEDAQNNENAWTCPNYNYGRGFPGDCGPDGTTRTNQGSIFREDRGISSGANDVAWFAENQGKELRSMTLTPTSRSAGNSFGGLVSTLIGTNNIPGDVYTAEEDGALYVSASGKDIWSSSDGIRFVYEDSSGDLTISVKVSSIDYRESWTKTGLMVRDSLKADAKHFSVILTGKNDVTTIWREQDGGRSSASGNVRNVEHESIWLKLTKRGDTFRGFKSLDDGETWAMVSTERTVVMNATDLKVGLAVTSHHTGKLTEVKFENYSNETYEFPSSAPSGSPAPSYGHQALDIRNFVIKKPSDVVVQGDKTIVESAGRQIWGTYDEFTFLNHKATGDFTMSVRVNSLQAPTSWSKMGIMVRQSLAAGSKNLFLALAPKQGIIRQVRKETGGSTVNRHYKRKAQDTVWLRIKREGNVLTCWESVVGNPDDSEWHPVRQGETFTTSDIDFGSAATLEVGIAMTSSSSSTYAKAEFEHFSLVQAGSP